MQIKTAGYKSGKVFSICGDLGKILKSETVQVFLQQMKNLCIMQKRISFLLNPYALVELKFH